MHLDFHKNHWLLFGTILCGFLVLASIIAVAPAIGVQGEVRPLPGTEAPTALEREGLKVYVSEGCVACHTQQVRPLEMDGLWGRASVPDDYAHVTPLGPWSPYAPAVLGSSRTGPDLANVGARQSSATWQAIHLYQPRAVVPDSVMPAYPWLFDVVAEAPADATVVPVPAPYGPETGSVVLGEKGEALVAYLLSLRQAPLPDAAAARAAAATTTAGITDATAKGGDAR